MARLNRRAARLGALATAMLVALPLVPATQAAGGTFAPYATVSIPSEPDAVAIGDVTGDGLADVVATTGYSLDPSVDFKLAVLPQLAGGTLGAPVLYSTAGTYPDRPGSLDLGDVTGDGRIDVVVGVRDIGIQLFPQLADGTLGAPTLTPSTDSLRVRLGNFDKDGALDAVGIGWGSDTATVFSNQGGVLVATSPIAVTHDGWDDLEAADVSGDGRDDIVVMSGQGLVPNIQVLTQLAGGGFAAPVASSVPGGALTQGIGVGDVTGDGRVDVVASYGGNRPSSGLAVFAQTAGGTLAAAVTHPSGDVPEPVEVADVTGDGRDDVVLAHGGWNLAGVYRGTSGGTLGTEETYAIPYASRYGTDGLAVGDITGDGAPEVVIADYNHGLIVLRNTGLTTPPPTPSPTPSYTLPPPTPTPTASPTPIPSPTPSPTPAPVPPSVPRSLVASPNLPAGVGLSWQAPLTAGSSPVTGYRIYRATGAAAVTPLVTVGSVLAFTDASVSNGTSYRYAVAAISAAGEGPKTAEVTAARGTAPSAPRNLTAAATKSGIALTWAAPTSTGGSAITGYRVYRGTIAGAGTLYVSYGPTAIGMTDTSVTRRTTYYYTVTAVNALGESVATGQVSATAR